MRKKVILDIKGILTKKRKGKKIMNCRVTEIPKAEMKNYLISITTGNQTEIHQVQADYFETDDCGKMNFYVRDEIIFMANTWDFMRKLPNLQTVQDENEKKNTIFQKLEKLKKTK